ncbi:MAG TPA: trypsin-like peptidase domain-containing protein [Nitrospiraceae bacterium]|nr:trypsin-like peptidase domain-containing protein [Nitrospiraceae bacterium]
MLSHRSASFVAPPPFVAGLSLSVMLVVAPLLHAEQNSIISQSVLVQAKQATVGILEDTQDQRTPDKPGKLLIRGTGFHLRDGYIVTARHAAEKHDPTTGTNIIQKQVRILTTDLHELPADLVGDSAFMDVVVYRVTQPYRSKLPAGTAFAGGDVQPGQEVFTIGYPMGWGPTMAFGRLGNTNTFLQTVDTRLIQADLSACSGNSGGGLFNDKGEVVGIMHAIIQTEKDDTQAYCSRMAFAIPAVLANRIVTAALEGKPLTFSKMGIHMMAVKDGTKWRMAVKDVVEPAKSAGIQKHDIIIAVDDTEINDAAHLKNYLIERTTPGQRVAVKVRRIDADLTFTVTLGGG